MINRLILIFANCFFFLVFFNFFENHITFVKAMFLFSLFNNLHMFRLLKSFYAIFPIIITAGDLLLSRYLHQRYYNKEYHFKEDLYLFLIILIITLVFSFIDKRALKEVDGNFVSFLQNQVLTFSSVYLYFYYFKIFHQQVEQITSITFAEFDTRCFYFFVDFLILNSTALFTLLIKIITSVRNKQVYLKSLINLYLQAILATILYNLLYNQNLNNYLYKMLNKNIPQPYNVLLYNSLPNSIDERYKLALVGAFTYFI